MDYQNVLQSIEMPFNPDDIEIVENGTPTKWTSKGDVMNFLMLASIASQAVKVRKYLDDRIPNGYIQTILVAATPVRQLVELPWIAQSVSCINDGPNPVFIWVNTLERSPHQINLNEAFNINFEVHKLRKLYFQCGPGFAAAVRVVAQD